MTKKQCITMKTSLSIVLMTLFLLVSKNCFAQEFLTYEDFGYAKECPEYEEPAVIITKKKLPVRIDHTKSALELVALSDDEMRSNEELIPAGVTTFEVKWSNSSIINTWTENDETCAQISRYELGMRISELTIYIASEVPVDSCAYREVIEHENKHVDVAYKMLDDILPVTEGYIRDFLAYQGVIKGQTKEEVSRKLQVGIGDYSRGLKESFIGVSKKLQMQIDSDEEYERLSKVCNGEISKIINKAIKKGSPKRRITQPLDD